MRDSGGGKENAVHSTNISINNGNDSEDLKLVKNSKSATTTSAYLSSRSDLPQMFSDVVFWINPATDPSEIEKVNIYRKRVNEVRNTR